VARPLAARHYAMGSLADGVQPESIGGRRDMSVGSDPQADRASDPAAAFLDLFDPSCQPDAPAMHSFSTFAYT
jgi:hypothetical protein